MDHLKKGLEVPEAKFEYTGENLKDKIKVGGSKPDRQTH